MTLIHPTAIIEAGAQLGEGVQVGAYSVVGEHVRLGDGTRVMPHVFLDGWTTIGRRCTIFPFASLGTQTQDLKYKGGRTFVEIGDNTTIREYVTVNSGTDEGEVTRVGNDCHIMAYCHVAHGCTVGNGVIMANSATLAGHVVVEDQAVLGGFCGVHQFVRIGRVCILGGLTKITQDCPPYMMIDGNPAKVWGPNSTGLKRRNVPEDSQRILKEAYKILYRQDLSTSQAMEKIEAELTRCPELDHLVNFIRQSERGIVK